MELTHSAWSLAPIGELLFLEQAWQGYREYYMHLSGNILADISANRIRFFHVLRRRLDAQLNAQKS